MSTPLFTYPSARPRFHELVHTETHTHTFEHNNHASLKNNFSDVTYIKYIRGLYFLSLQNLQDAPVLQSLYNIFPWEIKCLFNTEIKLTTYLNISFLVGLTNVNLATTRGNLLLIMQASTPGNVIQCRQKRSASLHINCDS